MKFHMLMFMNAWMMLVLMKCRCQMQSLTLGCYNFISKEKHNLEKVNYFYLLPLLLLLMMIETKQTLLN